MAKEPVPDTSPPRDKEIKLAFGENLLGVWTKFIMFNLKEKGKSEANIIAYLNSLPRLNDLVKEIKEANTKKEPEIKSFYPLKEADIDMLWKEHEEERLKKQSYWSDVWNASSKEYQKKVESGVDEGNFKDLGAENEEIENKLMDGDLFDDALREEEREEKKKAKKGKSA